MKITPFKWIKAILETCDNPDGYILLYRKGVRIGAIQPQTNKYTSKKDVVHELEWEDYPTESNWDYVGEDETPVYVLWVGNLAIEFDRFEVFWI